MSERVAVVGSRNYPDLDEVRAYVRDLPQGTVVVTGGARGVDAAAEEEARRRGHAVVVILPDYAAHGRRAPLVRNEAVAETCTRMAAFWDGVSTGTMHAVNQAKRRGRPVEVRSKLQPGAQLPPPKTPRGL